MFEFLEWVHRDSYFSESGGVKYFSSFLDDCSQNVIYGHVRKLYNYKLVGTIRACWSIHEVRVDKNVLYSYYSEVSLFYRLPYQGGSCQTQYATC